MFIIIGLMYLFTCIIAGILFGSIGSIILSIYENVDILKLTCFFDLPKCRGCKKKLVIKEFIPILGFLFQKKDCICCKKRILLIKTILEIGTAVLFGLVGYLLYKDGMCVVIFWMLTGWILLLVCICDIIRYEVHIPLIIFGMMLVLLAMAFGIYDWFPLWGAIIFLFIFIVLYFVTLRYIRLKYKTEEEGVGMGDVIISPYVGSLLYIGLSTTNIEELYFGVLMFFVLTGFFGVIVYIVQNVVLNKKAEFLSKDMADKALPLIPSMVLSLVVVIICHNTMFSYRIDISNNILEKLSNNMI